MNQIAMNSDLNKIEELEKAKQELENTMGLIAHKFSGSIQSLFYNVTHENKSGISMQSLRTMSGLLDIFSIISTSEDKLREKLIQDREGEGTILTTLEKSLSLALADLLTESNRNKILQHYLAYAKRNKNKNKGVEVDASVTPRQWARERRYLALWRDLQTQWQDTFMNMDSSEKIDWVKEHLFSLEIATPNNNFVHFEHYGVTESILVIAMTEIILNAIKYYSVQENTVLKLGWENQADFCIFSCENPYSENESQLDKGNSKGQIFLTNIARKLGGHFSTSVSQNHYTTEFKIPIHLLISE